MTLNFQRQFYIQTPKESGGGGGGESITIAVPNLKYGTGTYLSGYPTLDEDGTYHPYNTSLGWLPVKPAGALTSFHFHLKFTVADVPNSGYYALCGQYSGNYNPPQIEVEDGKIHFITTASSGWDLWIEATPEANTTYTMDVTWDNVSQKVVGTLLKEGETTPVEMTAPSGKTDILPSYTWNGYMTMGGESTTTWRGTIDLSECYIEWNNGELRWDGLTTTTITKSTSYLVQAYEANGGVE